VIFIGDRDICLDGVEIIYRVDIIIFTLAFGVLLLGFVIKESFQEAKPPAESTDPVVDPAI
jgi:hypothetical protein